LVHVTQDGEFYEYANEHSGFLKDRENTDYLNVYSFINCSEQTSRHAYKRAGKIQELIIISTSVASTGTSIRKSYPRMFIRN
jgi:hypothetical protein